jgi:BirA family biotin operon repressor/biotin-[acetyl-CoA-carboxylase] ligase
MDAQRVADALEGTRFRDIELHESLPSTQTLLVNEGGPDGRVVLAEHQTAGRGRAGRTWVSPPGSSLLFSVLLRGIEPDQAPLTSLAGGLAVARALGSARARLKWPNDVRIDGSKVAGVLGELSADGAYVVLGIGINVAQRREELPPGVDATSVELAFGRPVDREGLLVDVLRELDSLLAAGDWLPDYRSRCETIGAQVRVDLAGEILEGVAEAVRDDGVLIVSGREVTAGDVAHLRQA